MGSEFFGMGIGKLRLSYIILIVGLIERVAKLSVETSKKLVSDNRFPEEKNIHILMIDDLAYPKSMTNNTMGC